MSRLRRSHPAPPPGAAFSRSRTRLCKPSSTVSEMSTPSHTPTHFLLHNMSALFPRPPVLRCASHVYRALPHRLFSNLCHFASRLAKTLSAIKRRREARNMALRARTRASSARCACGTLRATRTSSQRTSTRVSHTRSSVWRTVRMRTMFRRRTSTYDVEDEIVSALETKVKRLTFG